MEAEARRHLRRTVAYRLVGDVADYAARLLATSARFATDLSLSVFLLEQDSARSYKAAVGTDLGEIVAQPLRYDAQAKAEWRLGSGSAKGDDDDGDE